MAFVTEEAFRELNSHHLPSVQQDFKKEKKSREMNNPTVSANDQPEDLKEQPFINKETGNNRKHTVIYLARSSYQISKQCLISGRGRMFMLCFLELLKGREVLQSEVLLAHQGIVTCG